MEPTRNIAVLIDGDNAQPKLIQQILEEVAKYGKATIRRIYGDWTQNSMNGWKELLNQHSINPIQKFAYTVGKNSTDGALIIEAMDILHGKKNGRVLHRFQRQRLYRPCKAHQGGRSFRNGYRGKENTCCLRAVL